MHVCLFDWRCWRDWWQYGMPLRIHWGQPGHNNRCHITILPGAWRSRRIWSEEPVIIEGSGVAVQPRRLSTVKSIRLSPTELEALCAVAERMGLPLGLFIKRAALQQAASIAMQPGAITSTAFGTVIYKQVS